MTKFAYVWRLEKDGVGAFNRCPSLVSLAYDGKYNHTCNPSNPPGPYCFPEADSALGKLFAAGKGDPYLFGFSSLQQYRQWFNEAPYRRNLAEAGGQLIRYRVPKEDVVPGYFQVVFRKSREAIKVEIRSPAYADRTKGP